MEVFGPKMSLLSLSIREGSADFLTSLATGENTQPDAFRYFIDHEEELKLKFKEEMNHSHPGEWLYSKTSDPNVPRDLGYQIGARITRYSYVNAADKN